MKTKFVGAAAAAVMGVMACLGAGCDDDDDADIDTGSGGRGGSFGAGGRSGGAGGNVGGGGNVGSGGVTGGGGTTATALDDPQIAGVMLEANNGEVHAGEVALARSNNPAIRDFAMLMINEHSAADRSLQMVMDAQGMVATDSTMRRNMTMEAANTLNMLWSVNAANFDVAYADSQIAMHTMVLSMLDGMLIPRAQNAALKTELEGARPKVASHLTMAQQLRTTLGGTTTPPTP